MEDQKKLLKLFIGGLSPHTTQESLLTHFSAAGSVKDCVLMVDRNSGRSRCFGFVTMEDPAAVEAILASDQIIDGKKADCKRAVPKESALSSGQSSFRTKKVFVGGLPSDITDEVFRGFFSQFGEVEDSVIMLDRDSHRPRGFGFITFYDEEATERLLENFENNTINGKWIDCKKAVPKQANEYPYYPSNLLYEHFDAKEFVPQAFYKDPEPVQEEGETNNSNNL